MYVCIFMYDTKTCLYQHLTPVFITKITYVNFTTHTHKCKSLFCSQKPGLNAIFKDFRYTTIYQTQLYHKHFPYTLLKFHYKRFNCIY